MLSIAAFRSDVLLAEASLSAISMASSISVAGSLALLMSRFLTSPTPMITGISAIEMRFFFAEILGNCTRTRALGCVKDYMLYITAVSRES